MADCKKESPVIWAESLDMTGLFGGELGIRTLETFRSTAFRVLHLRPLGQLSVYHSVYPVLEKSKTTRKNDMKL